MGFIIELIPTLIYLVYQVLLVVYYIIKCIIMLIIKAYKKIRGIEETDKRGFYRRLFGLY